MQNKARYSWLVLVAAVLAIVSLLDQAPPAQELVLRLGSDHRLSSVQLSCESGDHGSGARWNLDTSPNLTTLSHVFRGAAGEYQCEIVLSRSGKSRQVQRRISLSGNRVTVPLEHELAKLEL